MKPPDDQPSKGMSMIAAYRAARLGQRPVLRTDLRQSRSALRQERGTRLSGTEPPVAQPTGGTPEVPVQPAEPSRAGTVSVFAGLVGVAGAERPPARPLADEAREPAPPDRPRQAPGDVAEDADLAAAYSDVARPDDDAPPGMPLPGPSAPDGPVAIPPVADARAPGTAGGETFDPPLAEIGFGPGMLIRFSQLGLRTIGDLAQADAARLRASLGDISRLVDVETWINSARRSAARAGELDACQARAGNDERR